MKTAASFHVGQRTEQWRLGQTQLSLTDILRLTNRDFITLLKQTPKFNLRQHWKRRIQQMWIVFGTRTCVGINVNRKMMGAAMAGGKEPLHRVLRGSSALCSLFTVVYTANLRLSWEN